MEFGRCGNLIVGWTVYSIKSVCPAFKGRNPSWVISSKEKKINVGSCPDIYRPISSKLGIMLNTLNYIAWYQLNDLDLCSRSHLQEKPESSALKVLANFSIDLDEIWYTGTTSCHSLLIGFVFKGENSILVILWRVFLGLAWVWIFINRFLSNMVWWKTWLNSTSLCQFEYPFRLFKVTVLRNTYKLSNRSDVVLHKAAHIHCGQLCLEDGC